MWWNWRFGHGGGLGLKKIKKRGGKIAALVLLAVMLAGGYAFLQHIPLEIFTIKTKPEPLQQKVYDYYLIIDQETGNHLMYVPIVVFVGDELISENNKRYTIVEIVDNVAYARFLENVQLK